MPQLSRRTFLILGSTALAARWGAQGVRCEASNAWHDVRSHGPFRVQAAFPLGDLTPLFRELSALELEIQRTLAMPPANCQIDVYLLGDKSAHRNLLANSFPRIPYRRALYVQRGSQASVYAYRNSELPTDLRHECTHALLHSSLPMVPLWLDEGLAEYFEVPAEMRASQHPHFAKLRWNLRLGMIRSLESLESASDISQMGPVEYRFAWAWVHFMLHGPLAAHRELVHFLLDIRRGNPPGKLSERLRHTLPDLERLFQNHFKSWAK